MAESPDTEMFDHLAALDALISGGRSGPGPRASASAISADLGSHSVVDRATGLLMAGLGYDAFEAFDLMRTVSRDSNRSVGVVAQGVLDSEARARQLCSTAS